MVSEIYLHKFCIEQCGDVVSMIFLQKFYTEPCGGDGKCNTST